MSDFIIEEFLSTANITEDQMISVNESAAKRDEKEDKKQDNKDKEKE